MRAQVVAGEAAHHAAPVGVPLACRGLDPLYCRRVLLNHQPAAPLISVCRQLRGYSLRTVKGKRIVQEGAASTLRATDHCLVWAARDKVSHRILRSTQNPNKSLCPL